jgi:hypothetical protein
MRDAPAPVAVGDGHLTATEALAIARDAER